VRQTFADSISRADLCESTSDQARIARALLMIDCVQAKGLRKNTNGRLVSIDQVVLMFIEREAFGQQGLEQEVAYMDEMIFRGLLQRDKVDKFWLSAKEIILERTARKVLKRRAGLTEEELKGYFEAKEPAIDLEYLNEETRMRIDNLGELLELR
jgi:hypothetical protein